MTVHLITTQAEFDQLSALADGRAAVVKVPREALGRLLIDYSAMAAALRAHAIKVTEPAPKRRRATLG